MDRYQSKIGQAIGLMSAMCLGLLTACILGSAAFAVPPAPAQFAPPQDEIDTIGDPTAALHAKTLQSDTVWIADWTFDTPGGCSSAGWLVYDNRIRNDGSNYWVVDNRFSGTGGVLGNSAILGKHDLCWACDGYGNDWNYS